VVTAAEKLRHEMEQHEFSIVRSKTCSFGVTAVREGDTVIELLARADAALYRAKDSGRNRVESER
jgi:diguanylate cyclase (GGDEF)-like protein